MKKFFVRHRWPVLAGALLVLFVPGAFCWLFFGSLPDYRGEAELPGVSDKVSVYRDGYGVPHIFAATHGDALRALGYVHASERFFQMEMQRRAGQGRLAEAAGKDMVGIDKFIRTLGLYGLAESSFAAMAPETQALFQAYADGVNAWMASHQHHLPPEFTLLGVRPEPWKPADSVVWGKLMALQLSHNYKLEVLRARLAPKLSPAQMKTLFPAWGNAPVTMEPKVMRNADAQPTGMPALTGMTQFFGKGVSTKDAIVDDANPILKQLAELTSLDHAASNEWVIGGGRTQSGKPILANDPHLGLEAPILWYLARIVTPNLAIKGATVPGLPVFILGQNNNIAWGMTTTDSDVQDLFVETIDPKNPKNYLVPGGSKVFETHKEAIHIKGAPTEVVTIRTTRHGPVLSDLDPEIARLAGPDKVMALAFTGLGDKDRTAEALVRLNQATNWKSFVEAFRGYQGPPQNVVYADIKGDIGFINPGLVPVRAKGDGTVPADGASGAYDWKDFIPFEQWPKLYNPDAGFVFNANNALVSSASKNFYGMDWEEPYRAQRLQQYFDGTDQLTLDSVGAMQADHVSLVARQFLPHLLRLKYEATGDYANPRALEAQDMLRGWDGTMDKNRPEPLIFEAWLAQMHKLLLVNSAKQSLSERGPFAANSIASILEKKDNGWCAPELCEAISTQAFADALTYLTTRQGNDIKRWRWGKEHMAVLQHKVFKHVPWLSSVSDLSIASSGDFYTLDRGGNFSPPADRPFVRLHGGGYRGIYDLANPDRSRFMITTGQSGHIFSPHYGDLVPLWNDVKAVTLAGTQQEFETQGLAKFEFLP